MYLNFLDGDTSSGLVTGVLERQEVLGVLEAGFLEAELEGRERLRLGVGDTPSVAGQEVDSG